MIGLQVNFKNERQKIINNEKASDNMKKDQEINITTSLSTAPESVKNIGTSVPSSILKFVSANELTKNQLLEERAKLFPNSMLPWHQTVNEAAFTLAEKDESLLFKKHEPRRLAEEEVRSSYIFKKGKSRSTLGTEVTQEDATAKRPRLPKESRDNQIKFLSNEIQELEFK